MRHKIFGDFEIPTDHLIPTRRPYLMIIEKEKKKEKNLPNRGLCCPSGSQSENLRK